MRSMKFRLNSSEARSVGSGKFSLSGDMTVGALLDCGLDVAALERELATLGIGGYRIRRETRVRSGIQATKFVVEIDDHSHHHPSRDEHSHRAFRDIRERI